MAKKSIEGIDYVVNPRTGEKVLANPPLSMKRNFGKSRMRSEDAVKRRLRKLEKDIGDWASYGEVTLKVRFTERHTLRWVLGLKHEPFCAADVG